MQPFPNKISSDAIYVDTDGINEIRDHIKTIREDNKKSQNTVKTTHLRSFNISHTKWSINLTIILVIVTLLLGATLYGRRVVSHVYHKLNNVNTMLFHIRDASIPPPPINVPFLSPLKPARQCTNLNVIVPQNHVLGCAPTMGEHKQRERDMAGSAMTPEPEYLEMDTQSEVVMMTPHKPADNGATPVPTVSVSPSGHAPSVPDQMNNETSGSSGSAGSDSVVTI
jgi:hypothetical protein